MTNEDTTKKVEDKDLSRTRRMRDAESEKVTGARYVPESLKERELGSVTGTRAAVDLRRRLR